MQQMKKENTPPKFNIAPEHGWLEDYFAFGKAFFQGRAVKLRWCTFFVGFWSFFPRLNQILPSPWFLFKVSWICLVGVFFTDCDMRNHHGFHHHVGIFFDFSSHQTVANPRVSGIMTHELWNCFGSCKLLQPR